MYRSLISCEKRSKVVRHLSNLGNQTMFGFLAPNGFSLWEKYGVVFNLLDILIHVLSNILYFIKIWINLNKFHKKIIHKIYIIVMD